MIVVCTQTLLQCTWKFEQCVTCVQNLSISHITQTPSLSLSLSTLKRTMCTSTYPHLFLTSVVKTLMPKSCLCLISSFNGNIRLNHHVTRSNKMPFHFQKPDSCQHFVTLMIESRFTHEGFSHSNGKKSNFECCSGRLSIHN